MDKRYKCTNCGDIWDSLELVQNKQGDNVCLSCGCITFMIEDKDKRLEEVLRRIKALENKFLTTQHPKPKADGCYQFTFCNECMAYPMGIGCPNLTKGPVMVKRSDEE